MTRSFAEWDAHGQGQAVAALPAFTIEQIGDAPPQPLPPGDRPLSGVRVLDLTRVIAGPVCGRTLAAHGADVLLVTAAHLPQMMPLVIDNGRGKLSTFIDLRDASGRDTLAGLTRDADIFVQGYRPGAVARQRLRPGAGRRSFGPASSMCRSAPTATKARGRTGAASTRWCRTRTASTTRRREAAGADKPKPLPCQALDHAAGFLMAFGAMTALARRVTEGGSWHVRVSLAQTGHWFRGLGRVRERPRLPGSRSPTTCATGSTTAIPASAGSPPCATPPCCRKRRRAGRGRPCRSARTRRSGRAEPSRLGSPAASPPTAMPFQLRSSGRTKRSSFGALVVRQRQEARDHRRHRHLGGARRAVVAFERDAEPLLRQRRAEHALGAGLDEHARAEQRHDLGAEAAGAGDVPGLRRAGRAQPRRGLGALRRRGPARCRSARSACASADERHRPGRDRAAVDAALILRQRRRRSGFPARRAPRAAPDGRPHIAAMIGADRAGDAEEARMLARAVVVQRRRRAAGARERLRRRPDASGQCAPHSSAPPSSPARASMRLATATCAGSPPWRRRPAPVPRRRSRSGPPRRSRSAAAPASPSPPSADRPAAPTSPSASTVAPSASTTATAP